MITRITIAGCCGRMGKRIASLALADRELEITGAVEVRSHPHIGMNLGRVIGEESFHADVTSDLSAAAKNTDVIIDFTKPSSTLSNLSIARKLKVPIVVGTTGITDDELRIIESSSKSIPVLFSANMSIGINLLFKLAPEIASSLGEDYNVEIIEVHHNKKKDSPSGTAKKLAGLIADAKGGRLKDLAAYGREGNVGERPKNEIGIHSVRAGDVIGDHTIIYAGENERIEITHRATSRDAFAKGALRAAKFLVDKSPGLYNMKDVIEGL